MKALVVYYSLEGNTRLMAETIAATLGADLLELKPIDDIKPGGFMKYVWGGRQVVKKKKPELTPLAKNPQDYDFIILGTPVWAWSFTPALRSFFDQVKLTGKKVALFCCHGGGKAKTLELMKAELAGNQVVAETDFLEPASQNKELNLAKAAEWAKLITSL